LNRQTRPHRRKAITYPNSFFKTFFMKRRHAVIGKHSKVISEKTDFHHVFPALLADSFEVMEDYYREKIQVLNASLHQLNILDNAREIAFICHEITVAKEGLEKVLLKKILHLLKSR
jgi:hypothetical protein